MDQHDLEQGQGFEQVDADAVCEQCNTVNEEGVVLCKSCGNNLRDQRTRRIASGGGPVLLDSGHSKIKLLTSLLVVLGFLLIFYVLMNIEEFEIYMAGVLTVDSRAQMDDLWNGSDAPVYDEMLQDLLDNPTEEGVRQITLSNPQSEQSYSGRYLVIRPGELTTNRIIGEANLRHLGDRVLFVYLSQRGDMDVRGYAEFESTEETDVVSIAVRQTAEVRFDGAELFMSMGVSTPLDAGGHACFVMRDGNEDSYEALAYRVHNNF